jgi:hypothetical protein
MTKRGMKPAAGGLRLSLLALTIMLTGSAPGRAQQFSAELMRTQNGSKLTVAHLQVSGDHVRLESPDFSDGFFLIDAAKPAAYFVRPAARVFMDARQTTALTRLFVPVDPDNPCRQWQTMAEIAALAQQGELRCEPAGEEVIGGQETIGFRATSAPGRAFTGWIDRARRFPLRIRTEDGAVITAETIRDEPQAASLFDMPNGAHKFDPQALIEQIKQSDVWVAPPPPTP